MTGWKRWDVAPDELVSVELTSEQRELLWQGLHQWGGPALPTSAVARAMGFVDVEALHLEGQRIGELLRADAPMSVQDWARALVATEIVFSSSYYGAAGDWEALTRWSDEQTLEMLRTIQRALGGLRAPWRHAEAAIVDPLAIGGED
jgi:hypothetical protein